ncbi:MAG: penicillin-binding protein 1C [Pseudomonadota bacterium]
MSGTLSGLKARAALVGAFALALCAPVAVVAVLKSGVDKAAGPVPQIESSMLVVDRSGRLLRPFPVADGRWRLPAEPDRVDPDYLKMLIAFEDRRFAEHRGVDVRALARAGLQLGLNGRIVSGGSTLTMQVARLLKGGPTRNAGRKLDQILSALALEERFDKPEILRLYMNLAPFGGNIEGVRTASLAYFGKEPARLSAAEAALLVALPQAPEARRPDRYPEVARRARDRVLARALEAGLIDRRAYERALAEPVPTGRRAMPMRAAHLAEQARARQPAADKIALRIDARMQAGLEDLAREVAERSRKRFSLAIMVADIRSGDVLASVGSPDYFDRRSDGFIDMTQAVRSPGSTLKPLVYALAFSTGQAHPESLIDDRPVSFAGYAPTNFDRDYLGTVTVREALQLSLNVPAVQVLDTVGPVRLLQSLRRLGARPVLPDETTPNLAIGLGGIGLSLRDLVTIYAGLASGGVAVDLKIASDAEGDDRDLRRVFEPRAAWMTADILAGTRDPNAVTGRGFAFKTGTTYGYRDAWAIGFDGRHVIGIWAGRPDGKPVPGLVGIDVAAPVLADAFARIGSLVPLPPAPPGANARRTVDLPARLRHIGRAASERSTTAGGPQLAYPPDRARIALTESTAAAGPLPLKVRNGKMPYTYFINGTPIARRLFSTSAEWVPDTRGFVDIVVIDAAGQSARAQVFLE